MTDDLIFRKLAMYWFCRYGKCVNSCDDDDDDSGCRDCGDIIDNADDDDDDVDGDAAAEDHGVESVIWTRKRFPLGTYACGADGDGAGDDVSNGAVK